MTIRRFQPRQPLNLILFLRITGGQGQRGELPSPWQDIGHNLLSRWI